EQPAMSIELDFTVAAEGLVFPEGPVVMPDGSLYVVEPPAGRVTHVSPDGTKRVVAGVGLGPNGLAFGPDGAIYVTNSGGHGDSRKLNRVNMPRPKWDAFRGGLIQRLDPETGAFETLYDRWGDGQLFQAPNDLVFDREGGFWF